MKPIDSLSELQELEYRTLAVFADFCEEHKLTYYLAFGTLLGAVRHNGFIPWDDDIDVLMPRKDYQEFLHFTRNTVLSGRYRVASHETDKNYIYSFAKMYDMTTKVVEHNSWIKNNFGVFIDIFPLDGYSAKRPERLLYRMYPFLLQCSFRNFHRSDNGLADALEFILYTIFRVIGHHRLILRYDRLLMKHSPDDSQSVGMFVGRQFTERTLWDTGCFSGTVKVEFCHRLFPIPCQYDEVLRQCYGNYRKLPREEDRVRKHNSEAYYI